MRHRMRTSTGSSAVALPLLAFAFAIASAAHAQTPPPPGANPAPAPAAVARDGKHYRVEFHPGALPEALAGRLADDALAAAESGWPLLDRRLGIRLKAPPVVHVFADGEEFRRAGVPQLVSRGEFASADAAAGFVRMTPALSTPLLGVAGLPWPTCCAVLRLAIRTSVAQQLPGVDPNDDWTVDLLVLATSEDTIDPLRKPGVDAGRDTRRCRWDSDWGRAQQLKSLVESNWPDTTREDRESSLAVLAEFLHVANQDASRLLLDAARRKYATRVEAQRTAGEAILGRDWKKRQERFAAFVAGLHPVWDERVPMIDLRGKRWLLASAFSDRIPLAHAYRTDPVPAGDYGVHCTVELITGESEFRLLLDSDRGEALMLRVLPDEVRLENWESGDRLTKLAQVDRRTEPGKPFALDADLVNGALRIGIDGHEVCSWRYGKRNMHRSWGLAAQDGVWVTDLRCSALPPKK
jgi:hypothetical protein